MIRQYADLFSDRVKAMKSSDIRELLKLTHQKGMISFAGGLPNPEAFPVKEIDEICRDILKGDSYVALQYGATEGFTKLQDVLVKRLAGRGMKKEGNDLLITTGSQQGLDLLGKIFINKDDVVIVEAPSYVGALNAFRTYQPIFESIWMDEDGIRLEVLRESIRHAHMHGKNIKFLYTIPTYHNPAGNVMSVQRRKELLEIASEYDILLVEDDPYGELGFTDEYFPPLKALDKENRVIYLGTFSKTLVPGFRCAWVFGPGEIVSKLAIAKQSSDLCSPSFTQYVAYEYIARGHMDRHLNKIKELYRRKAGIMVNAMKEHFPEEVKYTVPKGGMFIWARLPRNVSAREMFQKATQEGIAYVPGDAFYVDGDGKNCMRLNFTNASDEQIVDGIKRLGKLICEEIKRSKEGEEVLPPATV